MQWTANTGRSMPITVRSVLASAVAWVLLGPTAPESHAESLTEFNLPSQSLAESLKAIATQTNTNVMVPPQLVDNRQAPSLQARLTVEAAIDRLLAGTDL